MSTQLTTDQVWQALENELFAILGMVNVRGEARTVGIVYVTRNRRLYIGTGKDTWKARHVAHNPHVSITVPIAKRIFFMPWMKIPAATITFSGQARVLEPAAAPPGILQEIFRGVAEDPEATSELCVIEVTPEKEFITYGIGMPLLQMRHPEQARGRVPVGSG